MPTLNSNVDFCFINNNLPSTYDSNTIYFNNLNKNISVGNNVIVEDSLYLRANITLDHDLTPGDNIGTILDVTPQQLYNFISMGKTVTLQVFINDKLYQSSTCRFYIRPSDNMIIGHFGPFFDDDMKKFIILQVSTNSNDIQLSCDVEYLPTQNDM